MATFPTARPSYTGFTPGHTLLVDVHASQHNLEQADISALSDKVGLGASTPAANQVLTGNGTGTSSWSQINLTTMVSGVLPIANGGTGTTSTTGTGSVVFGASPTLTTPVLTTPTIADFTNANHNHQNAAGGGTLNAANAIQPSTITGSLIKNYFTNRNNNGSSITEPAALLQTGWGAFTAGGTSATLSGAVTFPVAFTNVPIVVITMGGDQVSGSIVLGNGANSVQGTASAKVYSITTSGFNAYVWANGNWTIGNIVYFQWIAIGV